MESKQTAYEAEKKRNEKYKPIAHRYETGKIGFYDAMHEAYQLDREDWISVSDPEEIPIGKWLFCLESKKEDTEIHAGEKNPKFAIVSGRFSWDMSRITHYRPLPNPPQS